MKYSKRVKASAKHKLGNTISEILLIIEGVVSFLSLGNWNLRINIKWSIYRKSNKFLCDL